MRMNAKTESTGVPRLLLSAAASLLALLLLAGQGARAASPQEEMIGMIPGTKMSRDEFRARAMSQLAAVALNAVAYHLVHGEYPDQFYRLKGSEAWLLDPQNMFSERPLQSFDFVPGDNDWTSVPPLGLPGNFENPAGIGAPPAFGPPVTGGNNGPNANPSGLPPQETWIFSSAGGRRVDPAKISGWSEGDIFYYAKNDLLQLVLFAPDGSYYEWVDEVPNPNYREHLRLRSTNDPDGNKQYSSAVLYFSEILLPRYYNLVQFMANKSTEPQQALDRSSLEQRLAMAQDLGIAIRNPLAHKQAIAIDGGPGDFVSGGGEELQIALANGQPATLLDLCLSPDEQPLPKNSGKQGGKSGNGGRQPGGGKDSGEKPRPGHGGGGRQPK